MMIEQSRQLVEDRYCIKNGYKHNAKVQLFNRVFVARSRSCDC